MKSKGEAVDNRERFTAIERLTNAIVCCITICSTVQLGHGPFIIILIESLHLVIEREAILQGHVVSQIF